MSLLYSEKNCISFQKGSSQIGASVPRIFWWICEALNAKYLKAFLKHDAAYKEHISTRKEVDIELREDLRSLGMCPVKCWLIYIAVRLFRRKSLG